MTEQEQEQLAAARREAEEQRERADRETIGKINAREERDTARAEAAEWKERCEDFDDGREALQAEAAELRKRWEDLYQRLGFAVEYYEKSTGKKGIPAMDDLFRWFMSERDAARRQAEEQRKAVAGLKTLVLYVQGKAYEGTDGCQPIPRLEAIIEACKSNEWVQIAQKEEQERYEVWHAEKTRADKAIREAEEQRARADIAERGLRMYQEQAEAEAAELRGKLEKEEQTSKGLADRLREEEEAHLKTARELDETRWKLEETKDCDGYGEDACGKCIRCITGKLEEAQGVREEIGRDMGKVRREQLETADDLKRARMERDEARHDATAALAAKEQAERERDALKIANEVMNGQYLAAMKERDEWMYRVRQLDPSGFLKDEHEEDCECSHCEAKELRTALAAKDAALRAGKNAINLLLALCQKVGVGTLAFEFREGLTADKALDAALAQLARGVGEVNHA